MRPARVLAPLLPALALAACTRAATVRTGVACPETPIADGEAWVGPVVCEAQLFSQGENAATDTFLATDRFRAIVRHPENALTLPGLGGGTIVDAAPWGHADVLHEVVAMVGGGALVVDTFEVLDDGVHVEGVVRAIPGAGPADEGARGAFTWRVTPDSPWIEAEGAEGLWIHPKGDVDRLGDWLVVEQTVVGHDADELIDHGGVLEARGATRLLLATTSNGWREAAEVRRISGTATDTETLSLLAGDEVIGRVPVDGPFDLAVPAAVDGVVARTPGRTPSAIVPAGDDLEVTPGPAGVVGIRWAWDAGTRPRPVRVDVDGGPRRTGTFRIGPDGGVLSLGSGRLALTFDAGPTFAPRSTVVDVPDDGAVDLDVRLAPSVHPQGWIPANLAWRGDRSRTVRRDDASRLRDAVHEGLSFVVVTAEEDIPSGAVYLDDAAWIRWTDGLTLTTELGDITSWPWSANSRRSGHGAPYTGDADLVGRYRLAWGGRAVGRTLRVDLAIAEALGPDPASDLPPPDHVVLPDPVGDPATTWAAWWAWLDAGRFVRPSGPVDWLNVGDLDLYGSVELERALNRGAIVAGTGPWVAIGTAELGPGDVVDPDAPPDTLTWTAIPGHHDATTVDLVTSGGTRLGRWTIDGTTSMDVPLPDADWVVAVVHGSGGWAVSMPLWLRAPVPIPPDTGMDSGTDSGVDG